MLISYRGHRLLRTGGGYLPVTANQYHPKSDKGLQVTTLCKEMPEASKAVGSQECVLGMCMCVHVCVQAMCVCTCVCMLCVCICVGMGVCVGRCTCLYAPMCSGAYVHMCTCVEWCAYLYAPMCPGTYVHVCTHM